MKDKIKQSTDIDAQQQNYQLVCATPAKQDSSKIVSNVSAFNFVTSIIMHVFGI